MITEAQTAEPFFEVGKTYVFNHDTPTFVVDQVRTDDDGTKVAIGKDGSCWWLRRSFEGWAEKR